MSTRLNKDFICFKGDIQIIEYLFSELEDLDIEVSAIEWRAKSEAGTTVITKNLTSGITKHNTDVKVGTETVIKKILAKVTLEPADTSSLAIGIYTYQLMVKDTASKYVTCAAGNMELRNAYRS